MIHDSFAIQQKLYYADSIQRHWPKKYLTYSTMEIIKIL